MLRQPSASAIRQEEGSSARFRKSRGLPLPRRARGSLVERSCSVCGRKPPRSREGRRDVLTPPLTLSVALAASRALTRRGMLFVIIRRTLGIHPFTGIGDFLLGVTPEDIAARVGAVGQDFERNAFQQEKADRYVQHGVFVYDNAEGRSEAIEVYSGCPLLKTCPVLVWLLDHAPYALTIHKY